MDVSYYRAIQLLLPKLPLVLRTAIAHTFGLSEQSKFLDLQSTLTVAVLRAFLTPNPNETPRSLSAVQNLTLKDPGVKGKTWVSKYASPIPPETDVLDSLMKAVDDMRDPNAPHTELRRPEIISVEAEWTGFRASANNNDPLPRISEKELYTELMKEVSHPTTVLYLHGGAYYLCDPAIYRKNTSKIARITGGRCYSVRYRLAPQDPFPAALLDALISYLTLLYPPPDAYHEAVEPEHIVFAGDSAGGNLVLALAQLLLQFRRKGMTINWHGEARELPLPAGLACNSPWLDISQSSPGWDGDVGSIWDYLPTPAQAAKVKRKDCSIWPASPPRKHIYVDDAYITHPLAAVILAESWEGMPPTYICTGWEPLAHEDKYLTKRLATREKIPVVFEEYQAMPHCFALLLEKSPITKRCFEGWAGFMKKAVDEGQGGIVSKAIEIKAKTLEEVPLEFDGLSNATQEDVRARMYKKEGFKGVTEVSAKL